MAEPNALARLSELIEKSVHTNLKSLYIGRIEQLDVPTAKIQPLAVISGSKQNTVEKANFIYIPFRNNVYGSDGKKSDSYIKTKLDYQKGDVVLVAVLDHDNQNFDVENPKQYTTPSSRTHSIDYSIVIGRMAKKEDFQKPKGGVL